jgi:A/G-specific adenine glycosylase
MLDRQRVHADLLDWYRQYGRDLPWRRTRDPYAILVAEMMLQQTQVDRVIPKWYAWLKQFPSIDVLAAATRADAIRAWQGLGYNLRAVRLHAIACQCMRDFGGQLPRSVEELLRLKGIGPYTAGAVACFAHEQPVAMVDTNIRRVLSRVFGVEPHAVEQLAECALPMDHAYEWNQALMDIGATLCRQRQPLCLVCPLREHCGGPRAGQRPSKSQGVFRESRRYYRGRLLDALRAEPAGLPASEFQDGVVRSMVRDGLIEVGVDGRIRLGV